jgi:hypothetical protein
MLCWLWLMLTIPYFFLGSYSPLLSLFSPLKLKKFQRSEKKEKDLIDLYWKMNFFIYFSDKPLHTHTE